MSHLGVESTFNISISNGDEDLGMKIINKNDPYDQYYSTGKVVFSIVYQD